MKETDKQIIFEALKSALDVAINYGCEQEQHTFTDSEWAEITNRFAKDAIEYERVLDRYYGPSQTQKIKQVFKDVQPIVHNLVVFHQKPNHAFTLFDVLEFFYRDNGMELDAAFLAANEICDQIQFKSQPR